jgi:hypothetical protein
VDNMSVRVQSWALGQLTLAGFDEQTRDLMESAMHGTHWVTVVDGKLLTSPRYEPLPDPIADPYIGAQWAGAAATQKTFEFVEPPAFAEPAPSGSPSLLIRGLCGYSYTKESYAKYAAQLESWGFRCYRCRRDSTGHYDEHWQLFSLQHATGELQEVVKCEKPLTAAVQFLSQNVCFGAMDVCYQRLALVVD